jgi:thioredoxin-dependent peroxiredoxin
MASTDPVETNAKFAAEHGGGGFPILSDTDKKVGLAYGVIDPNAPPERQRARRWTFYIGPDGKILAIDQVKSVRTAGEDTIKRLEELKVPRKK